MKEDKKKQLDRLIMMQRLKYGAIGLTAALGLAGFMFFVGYETEKQADPIKSSRPVNGVIVEYHRGLSRRSGFILSVKLDDGRYVKTVSPSYSTAIPYRGERVNIREDLHKSGRKSWRVMRLLDKH